ncbi:MAG: hypothetical protein L6Q77_09490 [Bacteroidetes bacterium]|nr:hypothetical protein [Bacteroidota bacterium]
MEHRRTDSTAGSQVKGNLLVAVGDHHGKAFIFMGKVPIKNPSVQVKTPSTATAEIKKGCHPAAFWVSAKDGHVTES